MKNHRIAEIITLTAAILILSACQAQKPAALTNDQVVQMVGNILTAIDAGDNQAFSRDLSESMKQAFPEAQFANLASLIHRTSGNFVSCPDTSPELSNNQGYAVYRLICTYELEKVVVTITFKTGGDKVEGLFFDSPNLRTVTQ